MAKAIRLYWDSCAWLGLLNGEREKRRELEIVYNHARQGKYELWTSTLSMVECRRLVNEKKKARPWGDEGERLIRGLFKQAFVFPIPLALDIADASRQLFRATPNLDKHQDAVHVASALRWDIETMHTYDGSDLLHLSGKLRCRNGEPLIICRPDETTDGPLFARGSASGLGSA